MSSKNNLTLQSFQACWSLTEQILRSAVVSRDQINGNMLPQLVHDREGHKYQEIYSIISDVGCSKGRPL